MGIPSSWYRQGTVSVAVDSDMVIAHETHWDSAFNPASPKKGDIFTLDFVTLYEILDITNTSLTLDRPYQGLSATNQEYACIRVSSHSTMTDILSQVSYVFNLQKRTVNELGNWATVEDIRAPITDPTGVVHNVVTPWRMGQFEGELGSLDEQIALVTKLASEAKISQQQAAASEAAVELDKNTVISQSSLIANAVVSIDAAVSMAEKWSHSPEDVAVDLPTDFSAKHYSIKAKKTVDSLEYDVTEIAALADRVRSDRDDVEADRLEVSANTLATQQALSDTLVAKDLTIAAQKQAAANELQTNADVIQTSANVDITVDAKNTVLIQSSLIDDKITQIDTAVEQAKKWAFADVDVEVDGFETFSSKHYAIKTKELSLEVIADHAAIISSVQDAKKYSEDSALSAAESLASSDVSEVHSIEALSSKNAASESANLAEDSELVCATHETVVINNTTIATTAAEKAQISERASETNKNITTICVTDSEDARDIALAAAIRAEVAAGSITGALIELGTCDLSQGVAPIPPADINGDLVSGFWKVIVPGTLFGVDYSVGDTLIYSAFLGSYYKIANSGAVSSVNGKTGIVVLNAADINALAKNGTAVNAQKLENSSKSDVVNEARLGLVTENDFLTHKNNISNPHNVSKKNVGLSLVNNWTATSDLNTNNPQVYATAAAVSALNKKITSSSNILSDQYNFEASGSETEINLGVADALVSFVFINGLLQLKNKSYSYDPITTLIHFAEPLIKGDVITVMVGRISLETADLIAQLTAEIDRLKQIIAEGGGISKLNYIVIAVDTDTFTVDIPLALKDISIDLLFIQGVQQAKDSAYSVDPIKKLINFASSIPAGTTVTIFY